MHAIYQPEPEIPGGADLERVRSIVLRHGWNATCYQIINPGISHWFSDDGEAVVGYVRAWGVRVVAGAPVCARARLAAVVRDFERAAAASGDRVCYFGAEARLEQVTHDDPGHSRVLLGAQPVWDPRIWERVVRRRASLRAQFSRARRRGVEVEEWSPERATASPELAAVLELWLRGRGLPPLHFLVEPATLGRLFDRRVFVAIRAGAVAGFAVASPIPCRNGWLIEQLIRHPDAPNGTTELIVDAAMRAFARDGAEYATLGLSPLSGRLGGEAGGGRWLRLLLAWTREHGRRFYNFAGLDRFKAKFDPERWDAIHAIANEPRITPRTMYAIARAFSGGSVVALLTRGIARSLRQRVERARRTERQP